MGEIVQFPGGASEGEAQSGKTLDKRNATLLLEALTSYISNQPGLTKNVSEREELVSNSSDEDLIQRINSSNENDWKQHPAYYSALINQLRDRGLL